MDNFPVVVRNFYTGWIWGTCLRLRNLQCNTIYVHDSEFQRDILKGKKAFQ